MPNVTWLEPQNLADLLAMNLFASSNGMEIGGDKEISLVSPWFTKFDLSLSPTGWHHQLKTGEFDRKATFQDCLCDALTDGWRLRIAVLKYNPSGSITKPREDFKPERKMLHQLRIKGANIFLVDDLHAKGIVTPLALVLGSTNYTYGGMHRQRQNASYYSVSNCDYGTHKRNLSIHFRGEPFRGTLFP